MNKFNPYLTPTDIIANGAFGGNYFAHPIVFDFQHFGFMDNIKFYEDAMEELYYELFRDINKELYLNPKYKVKLNMFKVKSGMGYDYWLDKGWIHPEDPHGWFEWYCKYYMGRRHEDDKRQISRWNGVCGPNGRWRKRLYKNISETGNWQVSPRIQQSLLHWGYLANKKDYELYLENQ